MKRIYSLNLISYLRTKGYKEVGVFQDEENGKYYYSFEESESILESIKEYKNPNAQVNLHEFIANFKSIKKDIYLLGKAE